MRTLTDRLPVLKALASDVRLLILDVLADPVANFPPQVDGDPIDDGICADFIRDRIALSASTTSRHLTLLVDAGLLVATRRRGWTFYRRVEPSLADFVDAGLVTARPSHANAAMPFAHVDVFATNPFSGNSLTVFLGGVDEPAERLLAVTQEMRHFESVFVGPPASVGAQVPTRVFDLQMELPFAGHPLIGAAAVLHDRLKPDEPAATWELALPDRLVGLVSRPTPDGYHVVLDQGSPIVSRPLPPSARAKFARAYSLTTDDLHPDLPLQVVSTGLAYVIVPVRPRMLERAAVSHDLTGIVGEAGGQFAVLFDPEARELRHWNNDGVVEDIATGSAAGTLAAYGVRHGLLHSGEVFRLHQGRSVGRPSVLNVVPDDPDDPASTVEVIGDVVVMGGGELRMRP